MNESIGIQYTGFLFSHLEYRITFNKDNFLAYVMDEMNYMHKPIQERSLLLLRIYIVQKGDTLFEIANNHEIPLDELIAANPQLASPDAIVPGMKIKIPSEVKVLRDEEVDDRSAKGEVRTSQVNERPIGEASESMYDDSNKPFNQPAQFRDTKPSSIQRKRTMERIDEERTITNDLQREVENRRALRRGSENMDIRMPMNERPIPEIPSRYRNAGRRRHEYMVDPAYEQMFDGNRNRRSRAYSPRFVCPCCMRPVNESMQMFPPYPNRSRRR